MVINQLIKNNKESNKLKNNKESNKLKKKKRNREATMQVKERGYHALLIKRVYVTRPSPWPMSTVFCANCACRPEIIHA